MGPNQGLQFTIHENLCSLDRIRILSNYLSEFSQIRVGNCETTYETHLTEKIVEQPNFYLVKWVL